MSDEGGDDECCIFNEHGGGGCGPCSRGGGGGEGGDGGAGVSKDVKAKAGNIDTACRDGACIPSAYQDMKGRFREEAEADKALVVHGWVHSPNLDKDIKHAWIEFTDKEEIWEPVNQVFLDKAEQKELNMRPVKRYNFVELLMKSVKTNSQGGVFEFAGPQLKTANIPKHLLSLHEEHHSKHMLQTKSAAKGKGMPSYSEQQKEIAGSLIDTHNWQVSTNHANTGGAELFRKGYNVYDTEKHVWFEPPPNRDEPSREDTMQMRNITGDNKISKSSIDGIGVYHGEKRAEIQGNYLGDYSTNLESNSELKMALNQQELPYTERRALMDMNELTGRGWEFTEAESGGHIHASYSGTPKMEDQAIIERLTQGEKIQPYSNIVSFKPTGTVSEAMDRQRELNALPKEGKGYGSFAKNSLIKAKEEKLARMGGKGSAGGGGEGGGGDGECCVFNQYGGGGCGPCNRGAGPELLPANHSPDHNYDSVFGNDKPDKDAGIQTIEKDGRVFFRYYAIGPGVNRHDWGVDTDYIADNMPTIMDSDITFMRALKEDGTPYYPHPAIPGAHAMINQQFQKRYVVGKPVDYERKPDENGNWYGIGEATEPHVKAYLRELQKQGNQPTTKQGAMELPLFVSPQILHFNDEDPTKIKKWWFQHVTITDDPAYPPAFAKITGSCTGDEDKCIATLKQAGPNLEMPCFAMAMKEIVDKNSQGTIDVIKDNNTSLISKQGTFNLDNSMSGKPNEQPADTSASNVNDNSNDQTPRLPEPQKVDAEKVNEHIKGLVEKIFKDGAKTEAERALLTQVETLQKQVDKEAQEKQGLKQQIDNINLNNTKRDIELLLIAHEAAFKDKEGKFDEKRFNEEVKYWLDKKLPIETIQKDIERVLGYAKATKVAARQAQYAGPGQSSEGESMDDIFEAPQVGANLPKEEEELTTEQASMSGQLLDSDQVWFVNKKGGRIA